MLLPGGASIHIVLEVRRYSSAVLSVVGRDQIYTPQEAASLPAPEMSRVECLCTALDTITCNGVAPK